METIEHRWIEKASWPRGPWDDEPDKVQWPDPATGLPCVARRHEKSGFWCGYVGIAPALTPLLPASEYGDYDLRVHGGITYSSLCDGDEDRGICHRAGPGEPDPAFWVGFDCHHGGDVAPAQIKWDRANGFENTTAVYRDLGYVREQCAKLAAQVAAAIGAPATTPERTE